MPPGLTEITQGIRSHPITDSAALATARAAAGEAVFAESQLHNNGAGVAAIGSPTPTQSEVSSFERNMTNKSRAAATQRYRVEAHHAT